ncbi:MAG: heparinase II/III family protein [Pseudomonadota bacterium]
MRMPQKMALRVAALGRSPDVLSWQPEPPERGDPSAARRFAGGVWLLEGRLAEAHGSSPWDISAPDRVWTNALHGQSWLDDVNAAADPKIWDQMSGHVHEWLDRFTDGSGPGWAPDAVARRVVRWIAYSTKLLKSRSAERSQAFFASLGRQYRFLDLQWRETASGEPRVEALCGLIYAHLSLYGAGERASSLIRDLGYIATETLAEEGTIASRNPEELRRIVGLMDWSQKVIESAGMEATPDQIRVLRNGRETLATLNYASGRLPRFHGGRSVAQDRFGTPNRPIAANVKVERAMGYVRMNASSSELTLDGSDVPKGQWDRTGHSSALAFELHHADRPLVGNAGSGSSFGPAHAVASRRAEAHSTIELGDRGPGQITRSKDARKNDAFLSVGGSVSARIDIDDDGAWAIGESDHYMLRLGLRIERRLHLDRTGMKLSGEDTALAPDAKSRAKIMQLFPKDAAPCPMRARFIVHPDVRASEALSGRGISLATPDGSLWIMRADTKDLALAPALYFDEDRPQPRATTQIVATTRMLEYWGRIAWSFERLHGTG